MNNMPREATLSPDAQGRAALLLCESLLHVLIEEGVIAKEAALSAVETVVEVMREMAENEDDPEVNSGAAKLAEAIAWSLEQK